MYIRDPIVRMSHYTVTVIVWWRSLQYCNCSTCNNVWWRSIRCCTWSALAISYDGDRSRYRKTFAIPYNGDRSQYAWPYCRSETLYRVVDRRRCCSCCCRCWTDAVRIFVPLCLQSGICDRCCCWLMFCTFYSPRDLPNLEPSVIRLHCHFRCHCHLSEYY